MNVILCAIVFPGLQTDMTENSQLKKEAEGRVCFSQSIHLQNVTQRPSYKPSMRQAAVKECSLGVKG